MRAKLKDLFEFCIMFAISCAIAALVMSFNMSCTRRTITDHTDTTIVSQMAQVFVTEKKAEGIVTKGMLYNLPIGKHIEFEDSSHSVEGDIYRDSTHYYFTSTRIGKTDTLRAHTKEYNHYHNTTITKTEHKAPWYMWLIIGILAIGILIALLKK